MSLCRHTGEGRSLGMESGEDPESGAAVRWEELRTAHTLIAEVRHEEY